MPRNQMRCEVVYEHRYIFCFKTLNCYCKRLKSEILTYIYDIACMHSDFYDMYSLLLCRCILTRCDGIEAKEINNK